VTKKATSMQLVAVWYNIRLEIARSRVRSSPAATVHKRQLSVPSLRGRLKKYQRKRGSKRSYNARDALAPYPWCRSFGWCPLRANEMEISAALPFGPMKLEKIFKEKYYYY